jgi:hypothetical protein
MKSETAMPDTKVTTDIDLDFGSFTALFLNCTLNPSPDMSHTEGRILAARMIMGIRGVKSELVDPVDLDLAPGAYPVMTEHGASQDDRAALLKEVRSVDILAIGLTSSRWVS